jgi:hypothetical protein
MFLNFFGELQQRIELLPVIATIPAPVQMDGFGPNIYSSSIHWIHGARAGVA